MDVLDAVAAGALDNKAADADILGAAAIVLLVAAGVVVVAGANCSVKGETAEERAAARHTGSAWRRGLFSVKVSLGVVPWVCFVCWFCSRWEKVYDFSIF